MSSMRGDRGRFWLVLGLLVVLQFGLRIIIAHKSLIINFLQKKHPLSIET